MNAPSKPIPAPDDESAPFWDGCRDGQLRIRQCRACGSRQYPPHRFCAECRSTDMEWIAASGRGRVYSWIVVVHPVPREVYGAEVPYVVALIDLEEGVRMASNVIGCDHSEVVADMPVEVVFEPADGGFVLPKFRPA